eukprot:TRINITY_DN82043_c0_g1_i1.p1 TRINITY_DN82043_c0_g1~~TRINITY_DN82043_c0_g1_i1.p1  ORF type:complete len:357 (-),score=88.82 TRINITY_DN82043_c0_g1_i1:105-1133(-)
MGACGSKTNPPKSKAAAKPPSQPKKERKKLDPADYIFAKKADEVLIKEEGSIDGEMFNVENCTNCDIFLLDNMATVYIDECTNCRIFVGPVESSVFLRNSSSCNVVIACQQLRTRDCQDCNIALFCSTEPIIETSQNMLFACFDFNYFSLRGQMAAARLRPWNNKWWQVYDFNKNEEKPNWGLLAQEEVAKLLRPERCVSISPEELQNDRVVPITLGSRPWPVSSSCFVVFLPDASEDHIEAFLAKTNQAEGWTLCRARCTYLQEDQLKTLLAWTKESRLPSQLKGKEITGIEICGQDINSQVETAISTTGLASASRHIRVIPAKETPTLGKLFFETWKDEV